MKKNQLLLILFSVLLSGIIEAQTPTFQWATNSNAIGGEGVRSFTDNAGNVYSYGAFSGNALTLGTFTLTHGSINNGGTYGDLFISKQDPSGNFIWAITPSAIDTILTTLATSLAVDGLGNLIAGIDFNPRNANSALLLGNDTIWPRINGVYMGSGGYKTIVAISPYGDLLWYKVIYKNSATGANFSTNYAIADNNNNFIVAGMFGISDTIPIVFDAINLPKSNPASINEIFFIKFDPSGNALYAKTVGGAGFDALSSLTADNSGNIYFGCGFSSDTLRAGNSYVVNSLGGGVIFPQDFAYGKMDSNGNPVWLKSIPVGVNGSASFYATATQGGEFYFAGQFKVPSVNFGITTLNPCLFALKADVNGNPLWAIQIGDTVKSGNVFGVAADALDNLYLVGNFADDSIKIAGTTYFNIAPGTATSDLYFIKLNPNGGPLQSFNYGSDGTDRGYLALGQNGTSVLSGNFKGQSISFGNITLTNPDFPNNDAYWASFNSATGLSVVSEPAQLDFYPNPAEEKITINLGYVPTSCTSFTISNTAGQIVMEGCIAFSASTTVSTDELKQGSYFIKIEDEKGIRTGKFMKL